MGVATKWCELEALPNRSQHAVEEALERMRERLPFPELWIDSDNDSAFINHNLFRYCDQKGISFTRSREYKKNDQAHVEQKNWTAVRQLCGYDRYESREALALLETIYADWRLYLNFFQPVRKRYDQTKTPYRKRVLESPFIAREAKEELQQEYAKLNLVELKREIIRLQDRLSELARLKRGASAEEENPKALECIFT